MYAQTSFATNQNSGLGFSILSVVAMLSITAWMFAG